MTTIAIAGNPNSGKSCVFNMITGLLQHAANYPGVTVETKEARVKMGDEQVRIVDLPGTYSLSAYSDDERVARDALLADRPELVIDVVDASNLERNLYLTTQLMEMGLPLVIALNMSDVARKRGLVIDAARLSRLLGIPVVETQANRGLGHEALEQACTKALHAQGGPVPKPVTYGHELNAVVQRLAERVRADAPLAAACHPRWVAVKLLEDDPDIVALVRARAADFERLARAARKARHELAEHFREELTTVIAEARYGYAAGAVRQCLRFSGESRRTHTDMIDAVVCHKLAGPLILAAVVFAIFKTLFLVAQEAAWLPWLDGRFYSPVGLCEHFFAWLGGLVAPLSGRQPLLFSVLHDAVIGGVGGVLGFVPLIFTMFVLISILEDTGYIARIAFITDRLLKAFGLQGKSIVALIVSGGLGGGGCAVPGILATRTLREEKDRLVTILVTPFMNCGAKLPVYAVMIGAFFPQQRGRMLFALWAISWLVTLGAAYVLRRFVIKGSQEPFVMELPPYHIPTLHGILGHSWERTWLYMKKAGTIILAVNLLLWALMYFPAPPPGPERRAAPVTQRTERAKERLQNSFAGRAGRAFVPISRLAGLGWRENVALMGGFAAKEVVIGTLGTVRAMGDNADNRQSLTRKLAADSSWSRLRAFAFMIFVMVYAPCGATLVAIRRETGRWKWALFATVYSTLLAFVLATIIFQIGTALGLGV